MKYLGKNKLELNEVYSIDTEEYLYKGFEISVFSDEQIYVRGYNIARHYSTQNFLASYYGATALGDNGCFLGRIQLRDVPDFIDEYIATKFIEYNSAHALMEMEEEWQKNQ